MVVAPKNKENNLDELETAHTKSVELEHMPLAKTETKRIKQEKQQQQSWQIQRFKIG